MIVKLFIGTYGSNLYICPFNVENFTFGELHAVATDNPSAILLGEKTFYCVNETDGNAAVTSFDFQTFNSYGRISGPGESPCSLFLDANRNLLLTADYGGGSVTAFSLLENGAVGHKVQQLQFGEQSRMHQIIPFNDDYLFASDLGCNCIRILRFNGNSLVEVKGAEFFCGEGSGPRHMTLNSSKTKLYCICEKSGELLAFDVALEGKKPTLSLCQREMAEEVPAHGSGDILIHPCGRFIYTSHRLVNDGISIYEITAEGLVKRGYTKTGIHPRGLWLSPDGSALLAACGNSNRIEAYRIDQNTGLLTLVSTISFENERPVWITDASSKR